MTSSYCDASDDPGLSHQVHEGVLNPNQDVSGHPVTAALLYVGARGMRVVTSRRWRPRCHRTVADWAGTRTGLWRKQKFLKKPSKHLSGSLWNNMYELSGPVLKNISWVYWKSKNFALQPDILYEN